ncbi:MAG TPA: hypothetical protein VLS96_12380 [Nodosilinea sp.]|nr:hypothetical protein [Nodosilinea sp.]
MRLYSSDSVNRVFSMLTALLAMAVFGFIAWKTFEFWRSDPALQEMQEILQPRS